MAKKAKTRPTRSRSARRKRAAPAGGKNLVIVESPAKARTINRYLGSNYVVRASMGHVRDLPSKAEKGSGQDVPGVDIQNDFAPTYQPLPGRSKVVAELKKYARTAPQVFLATDLDREGEAIAWHLAQALNLPAAKLRRVVFNEITAPAIREAFEHPGEIDMDKVNAQQARRILDRIVGYQVSPLLWKKVARGLSAGRVQTVAVRLIVERERQIEAFCPEESWRVEAVFTPQLDQAAAIAEAWKTFLASTDPKGNAPTQAQKTDFLSERHAFRAELVRWNGRDFRAADCEQAQQVLRGLGLVIREVRRREDPKAKGPARNLVQLVVEPQNVPTFRVADISRREARTRPPAPFTTASMQQSASSYLRFSASRTMRIAQQLYEGVDVPGEGSVGLITYMRTDSTSLSRQALNQVRDFIGKQFGGDYLPEKPNFFASRGRAQQAHEAIRPTNVTRRPQDLRGALSSEQHRLYELIWKRFVACQMAPAVWSSTDLRIAADAPGGPAEFKASGRKLIFDGFYRVTGLPKGGPPLLGDLKTGQDLAAVEIQGEQRFTQPPGRYTEASLVKALEAEGIGRPSTYAAIIQTIQDRQYVRQVDRAFHPTELGIVVTDKLVKFFPTVFDISFTAQMEDELDQVEERHADWVHILRDFYKPFHKRLQRAHEEMVHAKAETQPSDYTCPACGKPMIYRWSRHGRYLACTGYPDCKETAPVDADGRKIPQQVTDVACPKCSAPMVLRRGKFGPFLSCRKYPDCDGVVNLDRKGHVKLPAPPPLETDVSCPKCGAKLYLRRGKRGPWLACSKYPKCRGRLGFRSLPAEKQKDLKKALADHEAAHPTPVLKTLAGDVIGDGHVPRVTAAEDKSPDNGT